MVADPPAGDKEIRGRGRRDTVCDIAALAIVDAGGSVPGAAYCRQACGQRSRGRQYAVGCREECPAFNRLRRSLRRYSAPPGPSQRSADCWTPARPNNGWGVAPIPIRTGRPGIPSPDRAARRHRGIRRRRRKAAPHSTARIRCRPRLRAASSADPGLPHLRFAPSTRFRLSTAVVGRLLRDSPGRFNSDTLARARF